MVNREFETMELFFLGVPDFFWTHPVVLVTMVALKDECSGTLGPEMFFW